MDEQTRPEFFRRAIRRRWQVVLGALLLGLLTVPAYLTTAPTEYRAESVVFLEPLVGNPYSPTTPSGRQEQLAALTTEAGLLLTDSVVSSTLEAGDEAGVDLGSRIQERTFTEVPSNSQVVNVSFTAQTPEAAQFGAQALATAYLDYRRARSEEVTQTQLALLDQEIESLSTLVDSASAELDAAQGSAATTPAADVLRLQEQLRIYANQFGQLKIERVNVESAATSPGEIVTPARLPSQPEGLPASLVAAAIVIATLAFGVVAALALEHLDARLRSPDEVERTGATPVFGPAPMWQPAMSGTEAEDAYRLATLATPHGLLGVLGVNTSPPASAAAGLAQTIADTGKSVVVVLATPDAAPGGGPGLSDALPYGANGGIESQQFGSGIDLVKAGTVPEELPRLMLSQSFPELITALGKAYDVVLLVGPKASSAAGATVIRHANRTLIVAQAGVTRDDELVNAARTVTARTFAGVLFLERPARRWLRQASRDAGLQDLEGMLRPQRQTDPETPRRRTSQGEETIYSMGTAAGRNESL